MSRIRVIKPKKIIPKPKPMKLNSKLNHANTQIKDFKIFEDILNKLFDKTSPIGIISSVNGKSITVNYKISENVGFKKLKNGTLEIITTDRVSSHEKLLIKKIASHYNLFKAKKVLIKKDMPISKSPNCRQKASRNIMRYRIKSSGLQQVFQSAPLML